MEQQMKLSNETLSVLKNFGNINQGIYFKQGKVLKTVSSGKNILAEVIINEEIPTNFGVYNIHEFLSVISLHKETPTFEFTDKSAVIVGNKGRSKTNYRFCDPSMLSLPPEKQIQMPDAEISFELTAEDFDWILRSASVLGLPNIAVESDGTKIKVLTIDAANDAAHNECLEIKDGNNDKYRMIFKTENIIKILPGAYDVRISSKGISHFTNKKIPLQYWITTEAGSKFEKA
jgi:hypothetical protein